MIKQITIEDLNLSRLRKAAKINQRDFAKKLGIHPTTLCNIEKGRYSPKIDFMNKILSHFDYELCVFKTK